MAGPKLTQAQKALNDKKYDQAIAAYREEQQVKGDDSATETALAEAYRGRARKVAAHFTK